MSHNTLDDLVKHILAGDDENTLPPVDKWQPELSGDIDIRISQNGTWFHEGDEIKRHKLVKLFSSILKKEQGDYFLVTPVEKWRIHVEDVPFTFVDLEVSEINNQQTIALRTSTDDVVVLSKSHPLRVKIDQQTQEPSPYVSVRSGMDGRINRNTFYRLMELVEEREHQGETTYSLASAGCYFDLPV